MQSNRLIVVGLLWASLFFSGVRLEAQTAKAKEGDKWETSIRAFERSDLTNRPHANPVVFVGSSSIRAWKTLAEDFPNQHVINRGFGGSQILDSVNYVDRIVVPYWPKAVVFYAGDNDLAAGKAPEQLLKDFQQFVGKVHRAIPKTKIIFISIKPSPSRWKLKDKVIETNKLIQRYCQTDVRLSFVDVYTPMLSKDGTPRQELFLADNLHMNSKGYELWTEQVKLSLSRSLSRRQLNPDTRR